MSTFAIKSGTRPRHLAAFALAIVFGILLGVRDVRAEQIVFATSSSGWLVWIADAEGFFRRNKVDVRVELVASGVAAADGLLEGKYHLANMSEFAFATRSFNQPGLRVIGTVAAISNVHLVGRRDRGIAEARDLRGKKIGLRATSISEFFLGRLLDLNGVRLRDVQIVDLSPQDLPKALTGGAVDAVVSWEPYAYEAAQAAGDNRIEMKVQGGQPYYFTISAMDEFLKRRPGDAERIVRALVQASTWAATETEAAKSLLVKLLPISRQELDLFWQQHVMDVTLPQDMLVLMEDEATWRIDRGLSKGPVPDFLKFVDPGALSKVAPERVTIIR